jgi:hypothetical protein
MLGKIQIWNVSLGMKINIKCRKPTAFRIGTFSIDLIQRSGNELLNLYFLGGSGTFQVCWRQAFGVCIGLYHKDGYNPLQIRFEEEHWGQKENQIVRNIIEYKSEL